MFTPISINFCAGPRAEVQLDLPYHEGIGLLRAAFDTPGCSLVQLVVEGLSSPWLWITNSNLYITQISRGAGDCPRDIPEGAQRYAGVSADSTVFVGVDRLKASFDGLCNFVNPEVKSYITVIDLIPVAFWLSEAARFEEIYHICLGLRLPELAVYPGMSDWQLYREPLLNEWGPFSSITSVGMGFSPALMAPIPAATSSMFVPQSACPHDQRPRTVAAAWEAMGSFTCMTSSEAYSWPVEADAYDGHEAITTALPAESMSFYGSWTTANSLSTGVSSSCISFLR